MVEYTTVDGDVLDAVCWRHYGRTSVVEQVLAANPNLADRGQVYNAGMVICLPDLTAPHEQTTRPQRLWG